MPSNSALFNPTIPITLHSSPVAIASYSATEYLEYLFEYAVAHHVSDIHLEPSPVGLQIRIRQDGLLYPFSPPSPNIGSSIIARIKILAALDIGEKRLPQEGEFTHLLFTNKAVHLRTSVCPTLYGEKIVLRLFNEANQTISISSLGLTIQQLALLQHAIEQPQGLILVTGPTGSGKSTTLYSALQHLNNGYYNIMTVEDPIEMKLLGIQQVSIKPTLGFTFAQALRTFLRQDPDIIMIGEIRDNETATIALQAAQTGHLVLSTLHTNNCLSTLARLQMLNIDAGLLADTLLLIMSQRLVRRLCAMCLGQRCDACRDGFSGRLGVFELLSVSAELRELIREKAPMPALYAQAVNEGFVGLVDDAREKVAAGDTVESEVRRVLGGC